MMKTEVIQTISNQQEHSDEEQPPRVEVVSSSKTSDHADEEEQEQEERQSLISIVAKIYNDYEFLILIVLVIFIAKAYPPLGSDYLAPHITATWIGVIFIFLLAGLGLRTDEFKTAFKQIKFNAFVQVFNFGAVSALGFTFAKFLVTVGALVPSLADGMVISACLPMAINMVLILTKGAGGDEASAIFNAAFANMIGVFLSPLLILAYLGVSGDIDLVSVFYKLILRVIVPLVVGQVIQKSSKAVVTFMKEHKTAIKKAQIYALVFIVYTVFCTTFQNGNNVGIGNIFLMLCYQFLLLCFVTVLAWYLLKCFFPNQPRLRVMGLFGCTHKTVSVGVPLINAMYEGDPNVGLYTLPLLIWHPMQLVIGSVLVPRLHGFVQRELERLKAIDEDGTCTENRSHNDGSHAGGDEYDDNQHSAEVFDEERGKAQTEKKDYILEETTGE